jgi:hypothetical protein
MPKNAGEEEGTSMGVEGDECTSMGVGGEEGTSMPGREAVERHTRRQRRGECGYRGRGLLLPRPSVAGTYLVGTVFQSAHTVPGLGGGGSDRRQPW